MAQISRLDDCAMNNMVYIATSIASICVSEVASIVTLSMSHIPIPVSYTHLTLPTTPYV